MDGGVFGGGGGGEVDPPTVMVNSNAVVPAPQASNVTLWLTLFTLKEPVVGARLKGVGDNGAVHSLRTKPWLLTFVIVGERLRLELLGWLTVICTFNDASELLCGTFTTVF
jgi:hypothetical protein